MAAIGNGHANGHGDGHPRTSPRWGPDDLIRRPDRDEESSASGRRFVIAGLIAILLIWGSVYLAFLYWRGAVSGAGRVRRVAGRAARRPLGRSRADGRRPRRLDEGRGRHARDARRPDRRGPARPSADGGAALGRRVPRRPRHARVGARRAVAALGRHRDQGWPGDRARYRRAPARLATGREASEAAPAAPSSRERRRRGSRPVVPDRLGSHPPVGWAPPTDLLVTCPGIGGRSPPHKRRWWAEPTLRRRRWWAEPTLQKGDRWAEPTLQKAKNQFVLILLRGGVSQASGKRAKRMVS